MPKNHSEVPTVSPPAATGNAGPQFEGKVGASYLLSLLIGSEPRGLPGATIQTVEFQQHASGRPLDDVIIEATNPDGSVATLEIQAKRTLTFRRSDAEFRDVVARIWNAACKPEFATTRYELAVAIARTTTRIELSCQEVLHWARQVTDGTRFAAHINRKGFSSDGMRDFVEVFRANLVAANAPADDDTVWRLLRRFQILVFDFEATGSDDEHRARERARLTLIPEQANRAADLWPILIEHAGACARAGGALERAAVATPLTEQYGFCFDRRADLRLVDDRLAEAAHRALDEINDQVGGVRLGRTELIDQAYAELEQHRMLHISGGPGVGKSAIMKHLALRLQPEGRIIVLRNGRVPSGGWLEMSHVIGCPVSQDELFNELGCGGGAILFIDNIDQIDDAGTWATITDLLGGVYRSPGWRAVTTGGIGNDDWKLKLPPERKGGIATLSVNELSDVETETLSRENRALAIILGKDHPARGIARNLFYLSRMIELGANEEGDAASIATEMDLARLWWRYGAGRSEDDRLFARKKMLRAMGTQFIANPGRVSFRADDFESSTVAELLRFDSLREDIKGATVAFRHDVLRDWTIGFLLQEDNDLLRNFPVERPLPVGLARGIEITARLAIEADATGTRWLALLDAVQREGSHGSWRRPVLLALPRADHALALFENLKPVLLANDGRLLSEIIQLMISVETIPLSKLLEDAQSSIELPSRVCDMVVPTGSGWTWLVLWLVSVGKSLPTAPIPDASKVFQAWLIATQHQCLGINGLVVGVLFEWLTLIEEWMSPRLVHGPPNPRPSLRIAHARDTRDQIRMTVFTFAPLNPGAAQTYVGGLTKKHITYSDTQDILRAPGALPRAAPKEFVDFMLDALIEKEDPDGPYGRIGSRYGPFSIHDSIFSPASPSQGPFLDLLESAAAEGLRLIRAAVEHATQWRREQYIEARQALPRMSIPFPSGTKAFEGDWLVYHWSRSVAPSATTVSALMALEAWGHRQIEAGKPFEDVLHDVLGPDGSSLAFVSVAVDLALSHWQEACDAVWPMAATPELLELDDARMLRDLAGVDRMASFEQEPSMWRVKRADLEARPSRRNRLSDKIGHYVFHGKPKQLEMLRAALEQARNEIKQRPSVGEDPINGLTATAERALRMTEAQHWPLVKVRLRDGSETEARQFQRDPEEQRLMEEKASRAEANLRHQNVRLKIQTALLDRSKSTVEVVMEGIEWAKAVSVTAEPAPPEDDEDKNYNKEWDRRAVVMAAALAARDYEGPDRSEIVGWALPILNTAIVEKGREYPGNDQIEYNRTAIAGLGFLALYLRDRSVCHRDTLLRLSAYQHLLVLSALGRNFPNLIQADARLPRSIIRVIMAASIHPRRAFSDGENRANQQAYAERVDAGITAERNWLDGQGDEPDWPELPPLRPRWRQRIRLPGGTEEGHEVAEEEWPNQIVDEHALGAIPNYLIRLTIGELPPWIVTLAERLMHWTDQANGPHGERDRDRDNRPYTWNSHFFDFLGILCVALPHNEVVAKFVEPITRFRDDAFHDAMASFLRGFDRAMQAIDTKKPENAVGIRELLAERIRKSWNYKRFGREKTMNSETHAGDALNAVFYQSYRLVAHGRPSLPDNWDGLDATMPTLLRLVTGAPTSGWIAISFLNLIDTSPRASLLPSVTEAIKAWCTAYGVDANFWSEKEFGPRVCAWLLRTLEADPPPATILATVEADLLKCLDVLIRSGVAQARQVEERITEVQVAEN